MSHLRKVLGVLFLLTFLRVAGADLPFCGSWYRDDSGDGHGFRTEITFGEDGTFSMVFSQPPKEGKPSEPIQKTEGAWTFEEGVIVIRMPSTAPVGVMPRADAKFRWKVLAVSPDSLATCEQPGAVRSDWKRSGGRTSDQSATPVKSPVSKQSPPSGVAHP